MHEQQNLPAKRNVFQSALRAVKGDDTNKLVEDFTAQMTLVAEGLCEDQGRLRKDMESLRTEVDRARQLFTSQAQAQQTSQRQNTRDIDRRLDEINRRLNVIENKLNSRAKQDKKSAGTLRQITWLVAIISATWIVVTLLNLIPH